MSKAGEMAASRLGCCSTEGESFGSTYEREVKVSEDFLLFGGEDACRSWECEDWLQASELLVKVADVLWRFDGGQEGWFQLLGEESVPVHPLLTDNG